MPAQITLKRVYDPADPEDGVRILVDRLWPRGVSKERAALDRWAKDAAPSAELRQRWHADPDAHLPDHFAAFAADYRAELAQGQAETELARLAELARTHPKLSLLYGARDPRVNHAVVLRDALLARLAE